MVFIVRMRHPSGTKRFTFDSKDVRWSVLQAKIKETYGTDPDAQLVSKKPLHDPEFLEADGHETFAQLGLRHGDMLHLVVDDNDVVMDDKSSSSKPKPIPDKRTNRCQHGPKGRCFHCTTDKAEKASKPKCTHPKLPGLTCMNCNPHSQNKDATPAEWLCNHDPNSFCPNCIQKDENDDPDNWESENKALCQHGPGASCIHCPRNKPKIKVDVQSWASYMEARRKKCKHPQSHACAYCAAPKADSYVGDVNCTGSHKPWPYGICMKCMPPNANLRLQKYRHCDAISFVDAAAFNKIIALWQKNQGIQRAALLFGKYIDEPTKGMEGAIRAEVYAVYLMPQRGLPDGVKMLKDVNENKVIEIAGACGLECVGWAITTLPRGGEQYHGDMLMSGAEIRQAARYQLKYAKDDDGHSRFVTLIVGYNKKGEIEPRAYQVSDQCVAMERDGLLQDAEDPGFLASRKAKDKECVPAVIHQNKQLHQGEAFLPDELLVKVIASEAVNPRLLFKLINFPYENATDDHLRAHLQVHKNKEYHVKFSDFNMILWVQRKLGLDATKKLAKCVVENRGVPNDLRIVLDNRLKNFM